MTQPTKLFNKNFLLLWQGQFVSQLGSQAYFIALMFWLKHATDSASLIGFIMMVSNIPAVLLGPLAGTFADTHSRKKIIVVCDLLKGVVVLCLSAIVFLNPNANDLIIASLFAVAFISAIIGVFFRPAVSASIPDIVPTDNLAAANSMNQGSVQLSTFLGQGVGGVLYRILGAPLLFFIDGITYIFSGISEMFIEIPQKLDTKSLNKKELFQKFKADTKEGFIYAWQNKGLKNLILMASILNFFLTPITILLPFYVEDVLLATTDWYGYILAGFGAGAMIGYLLAGKLKVPGRVKSWLILLSLFIQSILMGSLGFITVPYVAVGCIVITGIFIGYININIITILQISTPSVIRGRVFSLLGTLAGGLTPIAMGLAGVVTDLLNKDIALLYMICGGSTAITSLIFFFNKPFRNFLATEPEKILQSKT